MNKITNNLPALSLDEIMDRGIQIPKPNFILSVDFYESPGLLRVGGIYMFKHDEKYLYIGLASNLQTRLGQHLSGRGGIKKLKDMLKELTGVTIEIIIENNGVYREFYETYLISKYAPECNSHKTQKERINLALTSQKKQDEVVQLYKAGILTTKEITDKVGISQGTLYRILDKYGVEKNNRTVDRVFEMYKLDDAATEKIIQMYQTEDTTVSAMAEQFGVSRQAIYKLLKRKGIEKDRRLSPDQGLFVEGTRRIRKSERIRERDEQIKKLQSEGLTQYQIAEYFDVTQQTVHRVLKESRLDN